MIQTQLCGAGPMCWTNEKRIRGLPIHHGPQQLLKSGLRPQASARPFPPYAGPHACGPWPFQQLSCFSHDIIIPTTSKHTTNASTSSSTRYRERRHWSEIIPNLYKGRRASSVWSWTVGPGIIMGEARTSSRFSLLMPVLTPCWWSWSMSCSWSMSWSWSCWM